MSSLAKEMLKTIDRMKQSNGGNEMEYKGYNAVVTFDEEVGILHGEVIDTRDVITFQGKSVDELKQAFGDSVEEYLTICAETGRTPDKPFSGRIALRIEPEAHRAVTGAARARGESINSWIVNAIEQELDTGHRLVAAEAFDLEALHETAASDAASNFEAFFHQVFQHHSVRHPDDPVIPLWLDLLNGSMWTSDAEPTREIFKFDTKAFGPNAAGYSVVTHRPSDADVAAR